MKIKTKQQKKRNFRATIIIIGVLSICFRLILMKELEQSSILFVGIPTLLALLVLQYVKIGKTPYGSAFIIILIFFIICWSFFGEGIGCIIFMFPIFYGIIALILGVVQLVKRINNKKNNKFNSIIILPLFLLLMDFSDYYDQKENIIITNERIVNGEVSIDRLLKPIDHGDNMPLFLQFGFPKPTNVSSKSIKKGEHTIIEFSSKTKGRGRLDLEVEKSNLYEVAYKVRSDNSHIAHWLSWNKIVVKTVRMENNRTKVIWQTGFQCELGPSWYFKPLENILLV